MIKHQAQFRWRFAMALVVTLLAAAFANAQTPAELRAKYGEPEVLHLKNGRPEVERYVVSPNIGMTITYTKDGRACEMNTEPIWSTPDDQSSRLMPTRLVISIINELVPVDQRGEKLSEGTLNGGDDEMKLHHPGCTGMYIVRYEHLTINSTTWCGGGTFSATIRFEKNDVSRAKHRSKG